MPEDVNLGEALKLDDLGAEIVRDLRAEFGESSL